MRAEILSIGTEIMLGEIVDTNAAYIAERLPAYGIDLLYVGKRKSTTDEKKKLLIDPDETDEDEKKHVGCIFN